MGLTITSARIFRPFSVASRSSVRSPKGVGNFMLTSICSGAGEGVAVFWALSVLEEGVLVSSGACFLPHPARRNAVADTRHTTAFQFLVWLFTCSPALPSPHSMELLFLTLPRSIHHRSELLFTPRSPESFRLSSSSSP